MTKTTDVGKAFDKTQIHLMNYTKHEQTRNRGELPKFDSEHLEESYS